MTTATIQQQNTNTGLTVQISPIEEWQYAIIRVDVNTWHGNLVITTHADQWSVGVVSDDGRIERGTNVERSEVEREMYTRALEKGWCEFNDGVFTIDLGQLDPWELGYCVQMAAFGEHIVG